MFVHVATAVVAAAAAAADNFPAPVLGADTLSQMLAHMPSELLQLPVVAFHIVLWPTLPTFDTNYSYLRRAPAHHSSIDVWRYDFSENMTALFHSSRKSHLRDRRDPPYTFHSLVAVPIQHLPPDCRTKVWQSF